MFMKKMVGRKGAASMSFGAIIAIIILVITAVIIIIGFTQGWDVIFGKLGVLPGNLEAAAQSCKISAENGLTTSYCYEFKKVKIGDKKQYANCKHLEEYVDIEETLDCELEKVTKAKEALCKDKKDEIVNGEACS